MATILLVLPWIALAVAVLGTLCKGVAAIMHEYYLGRAVLLSVQQKEDRPPVA